MTFELKLVDIPDYHEMKEYVIFVKSLKMKNMQYSYARDTKKVEESIKLCFKKPMM